MTKPLFSRYERDWLRAIGRVVAAAGLALTGLALLMALWSYHPEDPGLFSATWKPPRNWLGAEGAFIADLLQRSIGIAGYGVAAIAIAWSLRIRRRAWPRRVVRRLIAMPLALLAAAALASSEPEIAVSGGGLGGLFGDMLFKLLNSGVPLQNEKLRYLVAVAFLALIVPPLTIAACGGGLRETTAWLLRGVRDVRGAVLGAVAAVVQATRALGAVRLLAQVKAFAASAAGMGLATAGAAAVAGSSGGGGGGGAPRRRDGGGRGGPVPPRRREIPKAPPPGATLRRAEAPSEPGFSGDPFAVGAPSAPVADPCDESQKLESPKKAVEPVARPARGGGRMPTKAPIPDWVVKARAAAAAPKTSDANISDAKTSDAKVSDAKVSDAKTSDAKTGDAKAGDAAFGPLTASGDDAAAPDAFRVPDPFAGTQKPEAPEKDDAVAASASEMQTLVLSLDAAPGAAAAAPADRVPAPGPAPSFFSDEAEETKPQETALQERVVSAAPAAAPSISQPPSAAASREEPPAPVEGPSLDLLDAPDEDASLLISERELAERADQLQSVLQDYGVRGDIIHVNPGPVVSLFELEPAPGLKASRVVGLADDIARSMSAAACRIAPVPGKNLIGVELPNESREIVLLSEILGSEAFQTGEWILPIALGKDIGGQPMIADLARMPHLLIAGTTGSGKSVAINTMLLSLFYRLTPQEVRLILIDPKMLELSVYNGAPHLLAPVVTEPQKAVSALRWVVREMESRYQRMARLNVRSLESYNERIAEARGDAEGAGARIEREVQVGFDEETGRPLYETQTVEAEPMPRIVVVIDEMADLMLVAGKEIERLVQRLAQMARAAGIHLIMATQRPSVDVITGVIKANFPIRVSFQVTSRIDSRTILNEAGAEQLLGKGDMLFTTGSGRLQRLHGPFVSDAEVEAVAAHLKAMGPVDAPVDFEARSPEGPNDEDEDDELEGGDQDLYERAVAIVKAEGKASTSFLQRRLQIGYNRAARLVDRMEQQGVVSAANHVGKREVLIADA